MMESVLTVYKASAGSGKTFTLAVQYIKLLVECDAGGEYAHVLAVTFTNKATTEMKERIISQLYGIGHSLPASDPYYHALMKALDDDGRSDLTEDEVRRRCRSGLHDILHDYNRFHVSTIDAFFQTVLRGLAHELGLTANLQVDIKDTEVLSEAVDRIVNRLQDDSVLLEWVYSLVRDQLDNNKGWNVTGRLKSFGKTIFNAEYMFEGDQLRRVLRDEQTFERVLGEIKSMHDEASKTLPLLADQLEQCMHSEAMSYGDISNGQNLEKLVSKLRAGAMDINISNTLRNWTEDSQSLLRKKDQNDPVLSSKAQAVSRVLKQVVEAFLRAQYSFNSAHLVLAHLRELRLLDSIDEEVTQINAESARFTLAKTPILIKRMIGESDAPFIFEKIGALLHHVMIDEFQDTSGLQWHNFRTLLLESYAKGGRNLIVGDVKQSIYRFRGGDWRLLGSIEDHFVPRPTIVPLDYNRRSKRRIVEFNNHFFQDASARLDVLSADFVGALSQPFSFAEAYADVVQQLPEGTPDEGYVSLQIISDDNPQNVIIEDLMEQIRHLHANGLPYDRMCILVRFNYDALPLIDAFARTQDMPSIISDDVFMLSASPAVIALVTALRAVADPSDQVSAYYLRQLGADDVLLDESLRSLPLYELAETLYRRLHLERHKRQEAYVFGFFDKLADFIHSNIISDVFSFLRLWDEQLSTDHIPAGEVDGIRILTIHKAKGLEYHTVFMPFCHWSMGRSDHQDLIWCHPLEKPYSEFRLLPVPVRSAMSNSAFAEEYANERLLMRLDELNALYVGFTRARANLYIWSAYKPSKSSKSSSASLHIGELIAALYPEGYETGTPVSASKNETVRSSNRMEPDYEALDISMRNYPLRAEFRQSNRSQRFVQASSSSDDDIVIGEQARQQQYIETGKLLHSVLQQVATLDDLPRVLDAMEQEGVISRHASDGTYVSVQRTAVEEWIGRGVRQPQVREWFAPQWRVFNECAIVRTNPDDGSPQTLRPDRVIRSADGQRIIVIDFKFGRHHDEYFHQVRTYMQLLAAMSPKAQVEGYLWYVYSGKVLPVALRDDRSVPPAASASSSSQLTLDF
ncbi:MAG: UvrD-helicase domain-containing protein [Bacteroidales bacterium]|nr:UvrD-helicase domain-containing protein [Bacteroidales bacterium]